MALDQTCEALAETQLAQTAAAHLVVLGQPDLLWAEEKPGAVRPVGC